jgi:hypothetical protein
MSLEQTVRTTEREKEAEERDRNRLEQRLAEQASLYESR